MSVPRPTPGALVAAEPPYQTLRVAVWRATRPVYAARPVSTRKVVHRLNAPCGICRPLVLAFSQTGASQRPETTGTAVTDKPLRIFQVAALARVENSVALSEARKINPSARSISDLLTPYEVLRLRLRLAALPRPGVQRLTLEDWLRQRDAARRTDSAEQARLESWLLGTHRRRPRRDPPTRRPR